MHRPTITPLGLPLRTWPTVALGILLLLLTIVGGFIAKSLGQSSPELNLLVALSTIRVPALDAVALGIHYGFEPLVACVILAVICLGLLWPLRDPLRALAFGSITSIGWVSSEIGKYTVLRPRPPHSTVHALILETANDSFPSGHTSFVFSIVCAIVLVLIKPGVGRRIAIVAGAILVVVVATSRLYLGVHYPTDVAGSVLISAAALMVWLPIWNSRIEPTLLRSTLVTRLSGPSPVALRLHTKRWPISSSTETNASGTGGTAETADAPETGGTAEPSTANDGPGGHADAPGVDVNHNGGNSDN